MLTNDQMKLFILQKLKMLFYKSNTMPIYTQPLQNQKELRAILSDSDQVEGENCFWNQTFDKGRLKNFVLWFLKKHGEHKTIQLVEELKYIGFHYATKAGISLGIEDLKIPDKKYSLIMEAEQLSMSTIKQYKRGEITGVERFQRLIDTWHRTSERLKQEVIDNFEATDILNPVYMMAFSGARGNISQVRQLVGMRGLMSDPQGQIIDFPIRSNFREGLTLTEYIISSYGARKGIVDTALRTANAGYLTRRLVDVAQHVIISNFDCGTKRGIFLTDMKEGNKTIYSLQNRLIGRVLARDIYNNQKTKIASRNSEISIDLASNIASHHKKAFVRSALTCQTKKLVCQLCYGWSLAQGNLVSIGEAVGVVAAQSIGEPGTQLTMRTFHTGGVFSGDVSDQIRAPFDGIVEYDSPIAGTLIRTPEGKIAFLTKNEGSFMVHRLSSDQNQNGVKETKRFKIPFYTLLFLRNGSVTEEKEVIAQISSINRQKNATDQAELTIKSELSGQFYSKILDLQEKKVGPKLKNQGRGNEILVEQFNENAVDTLFEAWGWGYAWVLSGKIYQLSFPSPLFPIFGDYVNKKTYMNQIKWNISSSFGTSLKLNMPVNKKVLNKSEIKQMREPLTNSNLFNKKQLILLKSELISFQLSKIVYKKIGYFLKLAEPSTSFSFKTHNFQNQFKKSFGLSSPQSKQSPSIISSNDTIFLLSSIFSKKNKDAHDTNSKGENILRKKDKINSVYPANWEPSFDVFLNWFPKRLSTTTGGLVFVEPLFFNQGFHRDPETRSYITKKVNRTTNKERLNKTLFQLPLNSKVHLNLLRSHKTNLTNKYFRNKKTTLRSFGVDNSQFKVSNDQNYHLEKKISKQTIPFFPTFIRRERLNSFQLKENSLGLNDLTSKSPSNQNNLIPCIANIEDNSILKNKSFYYYKKSDFKGIPIKTTSNLSKSLIIEQYHQKQFGTIYHIGSTTNKNKTKTELLTFGLTWKNSFKLNHNELTPNLSTSNYSNINKKSKSQLKRVFWVSQPFYNILPRQNERIFLNSKNKALSVFNKKIHLLNKETNFYACKISNQPEPFLFQINRQGRVKSFYSIEGHIQTNENLLLAESTNNNNNNNGSFNPLEIGFSKTIHQVAINSQSNLKVKDNLYIQTSPTKPLYSQSENNSIFVSVNPLTLFKKEGAYNFRTFNSSLFKKLKARKLKNGCSLKLKSSKNLTLKTFSKINSLPYFLDKKSVISLKKSFADDSKLSKKLETTSSLNEKQSKIKQTSGLFSFYFYSLFNKKFKQYSIFQKNNHPVGSSSIFTNKAGDNQFNLICSPYLKDQLSYSLVNLQWQEKPEGDLNQTIILGDFESNPSQLTILYNKEENLYYYGLKQKTFITTPTDKAIANKSKNLLNLSFFETSFNSISSSRMSYFDFWFKNSVSYKKTYLKTLLKLNKRFYAPLLKSNPNLIDDKASGISFLKQKRQIQQFINESTSDKSIEFVDEETDPKYNLPLVNIMVKPGWLYYTNDLSKFFLYNKKLIHPGKRIGHDFVFDSHSVYVEIISLDKAPQGAYFNSWNNNNHQVYLSNTVNLEDKGDKKVSNPKTNSENIPFNVVYTVKNNKCRFKPQNEPNFSSESLNLNSYSSTKKYSTAEKKSKQFFVLIRKATEYKLFKEIQHKKQISKISNPKNYGPSLYNLNESFLNIHSINRKSLPLTFVNKAFNSINLYSQYKNGLFNKQKAPPFKGGAQTLSKYPSSDLKVISNVSFYSSLFGIKDQLMKSNFNDASFKLSKVNFCGLPCLPVTTIKPINLSPLIISYKAPYSLDFPFKTPIRLFSEQYPENFASKSIESLKFKSFKNTNNSLIAPSNNSSNNNDLKKILYTYLFKIDNNEHLLNLNKTKGIENTKNMEIKYTVLNKSSTPEEKETNALRVSKVMSTLSSVFSSPFAEYSLGQDFEKSISFPNNLLTTDKQTLKGFTWNKNRVNDKRVLTGPDGPTLGSLKASFVPNFNSLISKEFSLYKTEFVSFMNNSVNTQLPFVKTYSYSSFEGELIYTNSKTLNKPFSSSSYEGYKTKGLIQYSKDFKNKKFLAKFALQNNELHKLNFNHNESFPLSKREKDKNLMNDLFDSKSLDDSCMVLTKDDQIAFYFPSYNYKQIYSSLENLKKKNQYVINDIVINFLNISEGNNQEGSDIQVQSQNEGPNLEKSFFNNNNNTTLKDIEIDSIKSGNNSNEFTIKLDNLPAGRSQQTSKLLIGDFLVYGDQISPLVAVSKSGQIIHINNQKVTIRQGQPIFVSPKSILHKYDGDFIDEQSSVITLSYQQLKTGDIIQGIPKVEQFFEARTTKRGRLFRDSLSNLLKGLFKRYRSKLPLDQAVRQSFYKIQQIIVDGVQRVYRSQGVTIADKHLEVIVKQMTAKVRIIEGGQTGFFPGEIVDLDLVEQVNSLLMKKIIYEPLVLGITKASLEVDSFLSAASFQQTTRVLSKAAISRKKDFLKGLKENVILGNLIPAGTGYLVYLDQLVSFELEDKNL
jgi:hypothetical protein